MTHTAWAYLFAIIICLLVADAVFAESEYFSYLMRKGNALVEWLAFWR